MTIGTDMREIIAAEVKETGASGSSGALPPTTPLPAATSPDVIDLLRGLLTRYREETTARLQEQPGVAGQLAEARDSNIRDEIQLMNAEMDFEQEESSPSPPQRSQSPTAADRSTPAQLATVPRACVA